jgi:hypothetical protein
LNADVSQINEGKVVEAEGLLARVLEKAPPHAKLGAYVARGTARALARNLQRAHLEGQRSLKQRRLHPTVGTALWTACSPSGSATAC